MICMNEQEIEMVSGGEFDGFIPPPAFQGPWPPAGYPASDWNDPLEHPLYKGVYNIN